MNKNSHIFCFHTKKNKINWALLRQNHPPVNTVGLMKVKTFKLRPGVVSYRDGTSQVISVLIGPVHQFLLVQQL